MKINEILNSIFFPRKTEYNSDEKDYLVKVDNNVNVGIRMFMVNNNSPTILFFHSINNIYIIFHEKIEGSNIQTKKVIMHTNKKTKKNKK